MQVQYYHEFIEELEQLDKKMQKRIKDKLKDLFRTPFSKYSHLAFKGKQFKGLYKLRVGDWRLIYKLVGEEVHFITLGHRSDVYK